jgi:hypothetical protein
METKTNKHGPLTAEIGQTLSEVLQDNYEVFYDHGDSGENENIGKVISTIEKNYQKGEELSQLDIAIVEKGLDKKIAVLIEIEENSDKPKTFLGDILGILMGNFTIFGREPLIVDDRTKLVIVGINKVIHKKRNEYIRDRINNFKSSLLTGNSKLGEITIQTYPSGDELLSKLPSKLYDALK